MDSFQLTSYKLRIVWNEATGISASFCSCDDANCKEGISIEREEFIPNEKICGMKNELYLLYRFLIKKSQEPPATCDIIVGKLIAQHRMNAFHNGGCDHFGYNHDVLYIAARLAVEFNLQSPSTLMDLIKDIYGCECSFDRLFSGVLNTSTYRRDFGTRMTSIRVLKFLLAAAKRSRMLFFYKGLLYSMPNVPLSNGELPLAATYRATGGRLVRHILIKYGAIPSPLPHWYESDSE